VSIFAGIDPAVQKLVLRVSTRWHRGRRRSPRIEWVVGTVEMAGLVRAITEALPSAESALLVDHPFYDYRYDWVARQTRSHLARLVLGPWKLGELLNRADGFIYIGGVGFLTTMADGGDFEFSFVRSQGKRLVCFFTGNDIRSPRLSAEREARTGEPNLATYMSETSSTYATDDYESLKRAIARSAEAHADLIFNADVGQLGYLSRPSEHFLYFHPDREIADDLSKFEHAELPVIVHAPSSPVIKGTQLVRAAIAELRDEGYEFEYVELVRQSHAEVQAQLGRAHIVLNQFYSEVPGVFGVEALAAGCVVLMRADEHDEPSLPPGSNHAWVPTRHHQVTKNLRAVLDDPGSWLPQAQAGVDWVRANAAASVTGKIFRAKLAAIGEAGESRPAEA
jgi:hypothetical protein